MASVKEDKLAELAAQGNRKALAELLDRLQDRVYGVCYRMTHHPDDALDLAQQTMLKVIQNIGNFEGHASIGTWVYRIATNESISHLRKRKIRKSASLDQPFASAQSDGNSNPLGTTIIDNREQTPEQHVQMKEAKQILRKAMTLLDEEHRAVLVLRDTQQLDYQQVAQVLDLPMGTVKSRLFRARLALREKILELESSIVNDQSPSERKVTS